MTKTTTIVIGKRDRRHLERWATADGITPETMLCRIIMAERIRRKPCTPENPLWRSERLDQDQGP